MESKAKASVNKCDPDAPLQVPLVKLDQIDSYEIESTYEQTVLLLENLSAYGDAMHVTTQHFALDFHLFTDETLEVEIFDERNGFTAIASELDLKVARKILEMAFNGESFNDLVPITEKPWWTSAYV